MRIERRTLRIRDTRYFRPGKITSIAAEAAFSFSDESQRSIACVPLTQEVIPLIK